MDITFDCAKCGHNIVVDGATVGSAIQCPKCGQAIVVPSPLLQRIISDANKGLIQNQASVPTEPETEFIRLLWKETGKTLFFLQQTEFVLKTYILFIVPPKGNPTEAFAILDEIWGKPLGAVLDKLRKSEKIPVDLDARLRAFKDERNWLAHKIGMENHDDIYNPHKFEALLKRLHDLKTEAKAITETFVSLCERWMTVNGYTKEQLEAETCRRFNQQKSGTT